MSEKWKSIPGFESYEASNTGKIRNKGGSKVRSGPIGGFRIVPAKELKPFISKSKGYLQVLLPDRKKRNVHRIIAELFCDGNKSGLVVNHINGVKTDNRAENLEFVTHSYNLRHPKLVLGKTNKSFGRIGKDANKVTPIVATNIKTGEVIEYECAMDAVRDKNFDSGSISRCCTGIRSNHKGWTFRFKDGTNGFPHFKNR